jgi:hemolysin III
MLEGEKFNTISHLVGVFLAIAGTVALLVASDPASPRKSAALATYGAMLIVLYLCSTIYHVLHHGQAKRIFHVFDHCAIYLLIAGTYTPLTLLALRGPWGNALFVIVWALAAAGIAKDVFLRGRLRVLSVILYVLMGYLVVVAIHPLRAAMPHAGIVWIAAGGVVYTVGIVFYGLSKRVAHAHGIWHLMVLAGSTCHYVAVMRYVVPLPG